MNKNTKNKLLEVMTMLIFLIFMIPFLILIINSAKSSTEIVTNPASLPENWGQIFTNVKSIWNNETIRYKSSFISSVIITVSSLAAISTFSSMAAWVLVRTKSKLSTFIFFFFIAGMVIPFQSVMFPLVQIFRVFEGVTGIQLLRTYKGMVIAYIGFGSSLSIFMFHGFIKSIPLELEEAATIDGCNKPQTFFNIVMPILKPIFVTILILNGLWIWNDFLLPSLVLGVGNPIQTIPLAVQGFIGSFVKQWDLILTAVLMAAVPIIILFLFAQKYIIKGMVAGSIK